MNRALVGIQYGSRDQSRLQKPPGLQGRRKPHRDPTRTISAG